MRSATNTSRLNSHITLIEPTQSTTSVDAHGEPVAIVSKSHTRWAEVLEKTGREVIQSGALSAIGMATCRVRYDEITKTINENWTVRHRGLVWVIRSVMHFSDNDFIELLIEKGIE